MWEDDAYSFSGSIQPGKNNTASGLPTGKFLSGGRPKEKKGVNRNALDPIEENMDRYAATFFKEKKWKPYRKIKQKEAMI